MSNIRLLINNLVDDSTLTGTNPSGGSRDNLKIYGNSRIARYGSGRVDVNINLGSSQAVDCFVVWDYKGTYSSASVQGFAGSPLVLSTGNKQALVWWNTTPANRSSMRLRIEATSQFDITRLYTGKFLSPEINADYGLTLAWEETSQQRRTKGGSIWSVGGVSYRQLGFSVSYLSEDDRGNWQDIARRTGLRKDIFISCFPNETGRKNSDYAFAAKFTNPGSLVHSFFENYATSIQVEEA